MNDIGKAVHVGFIASRRVAKESESDFQAFQAVASQVVDVIATAGVVLDNYNTVVRASPGAVQFGLVQNRRLIHASLVKLVDQARSASGAVQADLVLETGLRRQQVWVDARAAKFGENYVMLLVEDRTESRKLEDTRRDFVANVSHELKTPIGAIGLLAEAILSSSDDPEMVQKFANSVQKEANRLANLVQELIQLSKVQGTKFGDNTEVVDLAQVISEAVERNQIMAEQRNVKLASSAKPGYKVRGDHEMLVVAVRNLIENAIVYSSEGSQVGVGLKESNGIAEIAVTDSGIGIPEAEQERIFERFYRVDPSRSRDTGGTGLGLSIVKHTAANHGGEVRIFSKVGIGSTFTFRIPVINQEDQ